MTFGTWGLPQMIHKYYGIRDDREVRRGTGGHFDGFRLVVAEGRLLHRVPSPRLFFHRAASARRRGPASRLPDSQHAGTSRVSPTTVMIGVVLVLLIAASVSTPVPPLPSRRPPPLTMDLIQPPRPTADKVKSGLGDERALPRLCGAVLCHCQQQDPHPRHDVLFLGHYFRLLPRALCAQPVLEGGLTGRGPGRGSSAVCHRPAASAGPALLPFGQPAFFRPPQRPRSPFRVPGDACLLLLLCWVVSGIGSRMGLKSAAPNPAFYEKEAGEPAAVLR